MNKQTQKFLLKQLAVAMKVPPKYLGIYDVSEDDIKENYIYHKIMEGYNYIVTPRRSWKSAAAKMMASRHKFKIVDCVKRMTDVIKFHKMCGIDTKNIVFDEFEFLEPELQMTALERFSCLSPEVKWIFLTTKRNTALNDNVEEYISRLESVGKIRKFEITERDLKRIKKLLSL